MAPFAYEVADAVAHLRSRDPALDALIGRIGPFTLKPRRTGSLFEALLRSITYQQLHGRAAAAIHARVIKEIGRHGPPGPAALAQTPDLALRQAGLSGNKLLAVRDLAAKCLDGTVPSLREARKLADGELVTRLTAVRGIGPWTVHMLLIFYLGRPDVMPTGDYAIRAAFQKLYRKRKPPTAEILLRHARLWQPYRSVASWYLWRSLDTEL
jgi:DNA-3-methyladenine glycosylase II